MPFFAARCSLMENRSIKANESEIVLDIEDVCVIDTSRHHDTSRSINYFSLDAKTEKSKENTHKIHNVH